MRRKDRAVTDLAEILDILDRCEIIRLGLCSGGTPYIVPMNFAWEQKEDTVILYIHGASEGRKLIMLQENSTVCVEADILHQILRSEHACNWTTEYESVIGEGTATPVEESAEKIAALDLILNRYGFPGKPQYPDAALNATKVVKITLHSLSGKRNRKS